MATEFEGESFPELLAEETGEPVEKFEYDPEEHPIPELDDLESVEPEEVYD